MRLIDADKLMDALRGNVLVDVTQEIEKTISGQPTAYDQDKVIRQLGGRFCCSECLPEIREKGVEETCRDCPTYDVKKIVKAGGINEG